MIAIAFDFLLMTDIAFLADTRSKVNRFWSFFIWAMFFPFFINIIAAKLLWYVISLLQSYPIEIRFELYLEVKAILYNLIWSFPINNIKIVSISFIQMIWQTAITKSMILALILLYSLLSLLKWQDTYNSRNQILELSLAF